MIDYPQNTSPDEPDNDSTGGDSDNRLNEAEPGNEQVYGQVDTDSGAGVFGPGRDLNEANVPDGPQTDISFPEAPEPDERNSTIDAYEPESGGSSDDDSGDGSEDNSDNDSDDDFDSDFGSDL